MLRLLLCHGMVEVLHVRMKLALPEARDICDGSPYSRISNVFKPCIRISKLEKYAYRSYPLTSMIKLYTIAFEAGTSKRNLRSPALQMDHCHCWQAAAGHSCPS